MAQIRASARARNAQQRQASEKLSSFRADSSATPNGTALANYGTSIGGLHDLAGAGKRRRRSTCLRRRDCENLLLAAEHARLIGAPLNRFLTIHFGAAGIIDPVKAIGHFLKLIGDWLRCYNTELTAIWVRETDYRKGEHVHILLSIPPSKIVGFNKLQRGWFARIGAAWTAGVYKTRAIGGSYGVAFNPLATDLYRRALTGTVHYMLKGADVKAHAKFRLTRSADGGELWGKRCSTTENIGKTVRDRKIGQNTVGNAAACSSRAV